MLKVELNEIYFPEIRAITSRLWLPLYFVSKQYVA